jgi:hypothetical protein
MTETWPRCGHPKTPENTAPAGERRRCRECKRAVDRKAYRQGPDYESNEARRFRRQAELALLDKLLAEASMPDWYPHQ